MYMDPDDPIQIPLTFPIQDIGLPTPGTTNLEEPPSGLPPPPPVVEGSWPSTGWTSPEPDSPQPDGPVFKGWVRAHHMGHKIKRTMDVVRDQQKELDAFIDGSIKESEEVIVLS